MSTEQHEALKLADWLAGMVCIHPQVSEDDPGGYATEYDQKVDEGRLTIIVQHALIVQMAEALSGVLNIRNDSYGVAGYHLNGEDAHWDGFPEVAAADEAISAATQYLKGPKT